jgi:hypothetical protein
MCFSSKELKEKKKMKNKINIAKIAALTAIFLMITSMTVITTSLVKAQSAPTMPTAGPLPSGVTTGEAPVSAHLSFNPNPTGVGQTILINLWTSPAPGGNREHPEYDLIITNPSGTQQVIKMPSYPADGTAWTTFTPDVAGTWTIQFVFPGTYFPVGTYNNGLMIGPPSSANGGSPFAPGPLSYNQSVYYEPTKTPVQNLTVQTSLVQSWPSMPLPTGYWTRPVDFEFREWWPILGNYPWFGPPTGIALSEWNQYYPNTTPAYNPSAGFYPWIQGPTSAHIVWDKQLAIEGVVGGDTGTYGLGKEISGYGGKPNIILWNRAFQTYTAVNSTAPTSVTYWESYDIQTGQLYWSRPLYPGESAPTLIDYSTKSYSGSGVSDGDITPNQPSLLSIGGGFMRTYDPFTGIMTGNYSLAPLTSATYYMNGYAYGIQTVGSGPTATHFLINFTTEGASTLASRIVSNASYPLSSLPSVVDYYSGFGANIASVSVGGTFDSMVLTGYNLWTGAVLWNKTINEPMFSGSANMADHGTLAVLSANGYYLGFNEQTGAQVWQSPTMDYPWDSSGFGVYGVQSAYGLFYREAYSGVYAFNWTNGQIVWKFESPAVFQTESHYTTSNGTSVYPFNAQAIILDGMLYVYNAEHSPKVPYTRGWGTYCINATTGQEIWQVMIPGTNWFGGTDLAAAGGYLSLGADDGYQYYFGIGLSSTAVTSSPSVTSEGSQVLIQGKVLDESPAQPGTPCVSDDSMATQMEYLHKQMPQTGIYGNATLTGVPVTLTAIDQTGKVINIGTTTTNGYYGTFSYAWQPPTQQVYTITASFAGDDSYGSSSAATAVAVGAASAPTPTTAPIQAAPDYNMTIIGMGIAIILAVAIVGLLILRKRA